MTEFDLLWQRASRAEAMRQLRQWFGHEMTLAGYEDGEFVAHVWTRDVEPVIARELDRVLKASARDSAGSADVDPRPAPS